MGIVPLCAASPRRQRQLRRMVFHEEARNSLTLSLSKWLFFCCSLVKHTINSWNSHNNKLITAALVRSKSYNEIAAEQKTALSPTPSLPGTRSSSFICNEVIGHSFFIGETARRFPVSSWKALFHCSARHQPRMSEGETSSAPSLLFIAWWASIQMVYIGPIRWKFLAFGTSSVTSSAAGGVMTLGSRWTKIPEDPEPGRGAWWVYVVGQHGGDGAVPHPNTKGRPWYGKRYLKKHKKSGKIRMAFQLWCILSSTGISKARWHAELLREERKKWKHRLFWTWRSQRRFSRWLLNKFTSRPRLRPWTEMKFELAACTAQKRGSKRCATTAGKERLQISDSIPALSPDIQHTLATSVRLQH